MIKKVTRQLVRSWSLDFVKDKLTNDIVDRGHNRFVHDLESRFALVEIGAVELDERVIIVAVRDLIHLERNQYC
jgi:hypothetical protein